MRNMLVQALPASSSLVVEIDPPIADDEQPYLLASRGAGTIVVRIIDSSHIELINPTGDISPFVLLIGSKKIALLSETLMKLLKGP